MSFVSYAQNFEDVLLHRVFGGQETGFYVDVGAYRPVDGSTTKAFYDRGWSGINIEPGSVFTELAAARPRDVNLQMAVMDHAGEVAFIEDEADKGMSHVATEPLVGDTGRIVPCDTLESIVRAHSRGRPVDFVKVDAEGAEAAIVQSTNWRCFRPRVLVLEATSPWSSKLVNQEWEPKLLEQGFVRAYFDGINCFYIPEEEVPALSRHFNVPVNVLDGVVRHDHEELRRALDAQQKEATRLSTERDAIRAALVEQQTKTAKLTSVIDAYSEKTAQLLSERDSVLARLDDQQREVMRLKAVTENQQDEIARLVHERDTATTVAGELRNEIAQRTQERDAIRQQADHFANLARNLEAQAAVPMGMLGMPQLITNHKARRAALAAYKLVRPVVRPLAWRLRSFLMAGLSDQMRHFGQRAVGHSTLALSTDGDGVGETEMRRLATEMERALLTLAMERTSDSRLDDTNNSPVAMPATPRHKLLLPGGRVAEVKCAEGDLSILGALQASDGDWEPHVRRYLETVVRPDWVCADIGANIGMHTLSLAVLAFDGQVVAFEADPANFDLLLQNVRALDGPQASTRTVHVALWDSKGTLNCGGADELAGCSFVGEDLDDAALVERRLRTVVTSEAVTDTVLHMRLNKVTALPLDTWMEDNPLLRLDLIKLDAEGAEAHIIRGADATLRRHRPILIVEYNPACAAAYFNQSPDALYHELKSRFALINMLEPDATLTPVPNWAALQDRLESGKGWEDLVCLPT